MFSYVLNVGVGAGFGSSRGLLSYMSCVSFFVEEML